nr:tetratricopeptide repeat protein [Oceanobacillus saliphilus]
MYYGVGGIGKSSLQKQLKVELLEQEPNAMYTVLDFKDTALHSPARALLELVREITCKQSLSFPHFEIAYSIYFCKRNPDISYNEKKLPFEKELGIMASIVSSLDGMGIAGTVTGIVGKVYESKKNWNLNKDVKTYLKELENCSVQEIEEQLVAFFAFDLQQAIEKYQIPSSVIFLDTFEALWAGMNNKSTIHTKDKWIRDLIGSLPNVLFVICGREYLEWEKYDSDWKNIINHQMIQNFDYHDAQVFLEQCGIKEEPIRDKIIQSSGGYPYHLDLSVDTYFEMKNRGEVMDSSRFGSNKREILDRFLQYLTDDEIETLKIMSIARFYDKDIFAYLLTEYPTGYPITKYDDFNKFSFITNESGKLFIHAMMRQEIVEYASNELVSDVHDTMANYYRKKFTDSTKPDIDQETEIEALTELIYHQKAYHNQKDFISWLSEECLPVLKKLQLQGESRFLRETLTSVYDEHGAKDMGISLIQILVDMIHLNGEYDQAISIIDEYFDRLDTTQILESAQTAHLAIRKVHHQMFSMPVNPLIQELLIMEPILAEKNWQTEYNELLFMIGGNLGVLKGDLKFSRKWLVKAMRYAAENNQPSYYSRAIRKYVDVLKLNGHLKWAKEFCEKGISIAKMNGYERYEAILICTLADIYRMEKNYKIAENLLDEAMNKIKKVGIKGWVGHIHATYAEIHFQKEEYDSAAAKWTKALEIYRSLGLQWGLIMANIGLERCRLKGLKIEGTDAITYWVDKAVELNYQREAELVRRVIEGQVEAIPLAYL